MNHPKKAYLIICLATLLTFGLSSYLHAQDDVTSEDAEAAAETTLMDKWNQGGWAMYPLAMLSISMVGLIVYNGLMIRAKVLAPPHTLEQLKQLAQQVDIDGINNLCAASANPATAIFSAGMERISPHEFDAESIEKAMDEASGEELAGPFTMINYLNVIGTVAPMVGMLGTVSGMVKAFGNIAQGGMSDPSGMAKNISEALITTASGLIIAIPAMFAYFYFKNKYGKLVAGMGRELGNCYHKLVVSVRNPDAAYAEVGEEEYYEEEVEE